MFYVLITTQTETSQQVVGYCHIGMAGPLGHTTTQFIRPCNKKWNSLHHMDESITDFKIKEAQSSFNSHDWVVPKISTLDQSATLLHCTSPL